MACLKSLFDGAFMQQENAIKDLNSRDMLWEIIGSHVKLVLINIFDKGHYNLKDSLIVPKWQGINKSH